MMMGWAVKDDELGHFPAKDDGLGHFAKMKSFRQWDLKRTKTATSNFKLV